VADYHESLKRFVQPAIFDGRPITQVRWSDAPRHSFRDREAVPLLRAPTVLLLQVLSMAVLTLLLLYLSRLGRVARTAKGVRAAAQTGVPIVRRRPSSVRRPGATAR
jgi:hypothetical protein